MKLNVLAVGEVPDKRLFVLHAFCTDYLRMNKLRIYLKRIAAREWGAGQEMTGVQTLRSLLNRAEDFEPHPTAVSDSRAGRIPIWNRAIRHSIYMRKISPVFGEKI